MVIAQGQTSTISLVFLMVYPQSSNRNFTQWGKPLKQNLLVYSRWSQYMLTSILNTINSIILHSSFWILSCVHTLVHPNQEHKYLNDSVNTSSLDTQTVKHHPLHISSLQTSFSITSTIFHYKHHTFKSI